MRPERRKGAYPRFTANSARDSQGMGIIADGITVSLKLALPAPHCHKQTCSMSNLFKRDQLEATRKRRIRIAYWGVDRREKHKSNNRCVFSIFEA